MPRKKKSDVDATAAAAEEMFDTPSGLTSGAAPLHDDGALFDETASKVNGHAVEAAPAEDMQESVEIMRGDAAGTAPIASDMQALRRAQEEALREQAIEIAAKTMTGDITQFLWDLLRHETNKRPLHDRSESEQKDALHRIREHVSAMAHKVVAIVAAAGRPTIRATLEQIQVKDGIKGTITLSRHDDLRHVLVDATGSTILISVASTDDFMGERKPIEIKADQGDIVALAKAAVVHSAAEDNHADVPFGE